MATFPDDSTLPSQSLPSEKSSQRPPRVFVSGSARKANDAQKGRVKPQIRTRHDQDISLRKTDGWTDGEMAARPFNGPTGGGTDEYGPEREGDGRASEERARSRPNSSRTAGTAAAARGAPLGPPESGGRAGKQAGSQREGIGGRMSASRKSVRSDNAASHAWAPRGGKVKDLEKEGHGSGYRGG